MLAPIELNFYNEADEIEHTYIRNRVPTFLLDSAIELQKTIEKGKDGEETQQTINALLDFIVEFYGNKFSREDLKQKTDLGECFAIVGQVIGRAGQIAKQFANPTPPSPKKK